MLTIHEGLLSLKAEDASLGEITEELGGRLGIETVVKPSPEARVTMTFDHRTVAQVIEELRRHAVIAYVESGMGEERSIVGILAFPRETGDAPSMGVAQTVETWSEDRMEHHERGVHGADTEKKAPHQRPFQFTFDPSRVNQPR